MRYTEIRLAKIAHEMLADIDKETVDFIPNYDNSEREPLVLLPRACPTCWSTAHRVSRWVWPRTFPRTTNEVADASAPLEQPRVIG